MTQENTVYSCDQCKDKAYIGGRPCSECNPVGLPVKEVHPLAEVVVDVGDGDDLTEEEQEEALSWAAFADKLIKASTKKEVQESEEEKAVAEGKPHKHFYRKDGTCQCGQVKKVKKVK